MIGQVSTSNAGLKRPTRKSIDIVQPTQQQVHQHVTMFNNANNNNTNTNGNGFQTAIRPTNGQINNGANRTSNKTLVINSSGNNSSRSTTPFKPGINFLPAQQNTSINNQNTSLIKYLKLILV
jgi:hypothetical protein